MIRFKFLLIFLLMLGFGLVVGLWINPKISFVNDDFEIDSKSIKKLDDYFHEIAGLNAQKNQLKPLIEKTISDIFQNLDPHSSYIPDSINQVFMEEMIGEFEGIGIRFSILRDTLTVLQVFENGPSRQAGLISGDQIVKIGEIMIDSSFLSQNDVTKLLKGPAKTKVDVTVFRKHRDNLYDFEIIRDKVDIPSVTSSYVMDAEIGYIKLEQFSETTTEEFAKALMELTLQNMNHLIIDLRNNPGGILQQVIGMSDLLLAPDNPIVIVESNNGEKTTYKARYRKGLYSGSLYVLVDEYSASASEILAGAIQDNNRGVIIGNRTYGKGLVQYQTKIADSDYLRLTTSRFYTPSGKSIQKPYHQNLSDEIWQSELTSLANESQNDSLSQKRKKSSNQNRETSVFQGGIIPDIDINTKILEEERAEERLKYFFYNTSLIDSFLLDQIPYNSISTLESKALFFSKPLPDEELYFEKFLIFLEGHPYISQSEVIANKKSTMTAIKSHIGRLVYGEDIYYRIKNTDDLFINTALEEIAKSK